MRSSDSFCGRAAWAIFWRGWPWVGLCLACLLALGGWPGPARAQQAPSVPPALSTQALDPGWQTRPLGAGLQVLHDPQARLDLAAARAATGWQAVARPTFNPGFSPGVWWVRLRLHHQGGQPVDAVLDLGTPLQDAAALWQLDARGRVLRQDQAGDRLPLATWPLRQRTLAFPVALAPGEQRDLYLRLSTHDQLQEAITPVLRTAPAQVAHAGTESLVFGLYFGTLMAMLLYNGFLFASTRDASFGLYVLHLAFFLGWSFIFRGYAFQYLWPGWPHFNNQALAFCVGAAFATVGLFQACYLDLRQRAPGQYRALMAVSALNALCMLPPLFGVYALSFALAIPAGLLFLVVGGVSAWRVLGLGSRPARFLVAAFTALSTGVVLYYLSVLGVLPSTPVTEYGLEVGAALQVLLLGFGVADQMNTLRQQKLQAEREALAAQTALASRLDALVRERTQALESANQRLAEISVTDELTGAYNRRHFNQVFAAEVARHGRQGTPLLFSLFDVDHFKAYNDRYGHQAGDHVLQQIAQAVRQRLRRQGDMLFRLGGEEFGVLLSADQASDGGPAFVEALREAIAGLGLAHAGSPLGKVTASFGLVMLGADDPPSQPDALYALADQRLYQAKHAGRNRVASA